MPGVAATEGLILCRCLTDPYLQHEPCVESSYILCDFFVWLVLELRVASSHLYIVRLRVSLGFRFTFLVWPVDPRDGLMRSTVYMVSVQ